MAELLIKAVDAIHVDPVKDQRGSYKRGDVVVVMPDGHVWGKEERLPKFFILKVPGLSVAIANRVIEIEKIDTGLFDPDGNRIARTVRRRKFTFDLDTLSQVLKDQINKNGEITFSIVKAGTLLLQKTTREQAF